MITSSSVYCTACDNWRDKDEDFQEGATDIEGEPVCDHCYQEKVDNYYEYGVYQYDCAVDKKLDRS